MGKSPYKDSIWTDEWTLRAIFNEDRIAERGQSGDLRFEIKKSKECHNSEINNWVPGTLNQELRYYDENNILIAKAHRFLRPDGALAASGKIDPKRVVRDNVMYILKGPADEE